MSENVNKADFWHGKTQDDIFADFKKKIGFSQFSNGINNTCTALQNLGKGLKAIAAATPSIVALFEGCDLPKTMKGIEVDNKGGYIIDEVLDELMSVEAGNYCDDCELKGTHCEGARCDEEVAFWYEKLSRERKRSAIIGALGKAYFYNLSLKLKLRLLNY